MSFEVWHKRYSTPPKKLPAHDGWLEPWRALIPTHARVLDLGCGRGNDTDFLNTHGCTVVHTDFVHNAVAYVKRRIPSAMGVVLDHSSNFPFSNNVFQVVVGNLSLHYFPDPQLLKIIDEIARILTPNGLLLARVNSIADQNYGATGRTNCKVDGVHKQFYTSSRVCAIFGRILDIVDISEYATQCYGKPKKVIEILARTQEHGGQGPGLA